MILDYKQKFLDCVNKIGSIGEEYALAKSRSWQMQEMKYSVLSSVMQGLEGSLTQKELTAKGSQEYKDYLAETADAIKTELTLKAKYEKQRSIFESIRSLSSLEKLAKDAE